MSGNRKPYPDNTNYTVHVKHQFYFHIDEYILVNKCL